MIKKKKGKEKKRTFEKNYEPLRKLILWGYDEHNMPGFLVLYGKHNFKRGQELKKDVLYNECMLFRGQNGHFPSFESVKIIDRYDYKKREYYREMYYKMDVADGWGIDKKNMLEEFRCLDKRHAVSFPYFEEVAYSNYVKKVRRKKIALPYFTIVDSPKEVLKLPKELWPYYRQLCEIIGSPGLYKRKKCLEELVSAKPNQKVYEYLLQVGSSELVAGLFLELSRSGNAVLQKEAEELLHTEINWTSKSYAEGIKRCASIYLLSLDEEKCRERVSFLRQTLPEADLHPLSVSNREGKVLEGKDYVSLAARGQLSEFCYQWEEDKYVKRKRPKQYQENHYSDGRHYDKMRLKETIQQADIFILPDVIGKIAYYVDAPRLTYHLKANGDSKAIQYFRRYLRRIMDAYARTEEDKFIEAIKIIFTSYTEADYLCKFRGNFQFNYFIRQYLYRQFQWEIPEDYSERWEWMRNDQLAKLQGRFEFMPELWDRHLEEASEILMQSQVPDIVKAFYFILADAKNRSFLEGLSFEKLLQLSQAPYAPAAVLFLDILKQKLEKEETFRPAVLFAFFPFSDEKIHAAALSYWKNTKGYLSADALAECMLLEGFEHWLTLWEDAIIKLKREEWVLFIKNVCFHFCRQKEEVSVAEEVKEILFHSIGKLDRKKEREEIFAFLMEWMGEHSVYPAFLQEFIDKIIFSIPYEELKEILAQTESKALPGGNNGGLLLQAIQRRLLPPDRQIREILLSGSAEMVKAFITLVQENTEIAKDRLETLLLLLESKVAALNEVTKAVFETLPEEKQKELHTMLLDSPDEKAYTYGLQKLRELYEDSEKELPKEFILPLLEHVSATVKAFLSNKIIHTIQSLGNGDGELFLYYARTILFLPNKAAKAKEAVYQALPLFAEKYRDKWQETEALLLALGGSNCILDSERALTALAKMKKEDISYEG